MPKSISVLIPAYNAASFIEACLGSLAAQSFTDFEVVVSNDGSTDSTAGEVEKFIDAHPSISIKLISNPNGGVSMARKRALEAATGEWVTFLDSDDTLPTNALADLYAKAADDTDLVVGFITPQKESLKELNTSDQWQHAAIAGVIPPSIGAKLYRRSVLKTYMLDVPRNITNGEDALMNIAYAFAMAKPPKFVYSRIYNYTRQPLSLSHTTKRGVDYEYEYDRLRLNAIPKEKHGEYMREISKYRLNGVLGCSRSDSATIAKKEHPFFGIIREGMKLSGYRLSPFEWIAMNVKSPRVISTAGLMRVVLISLKYRTSLLFSKS